jgi:hypothetical protein
MRVLLVEDDAGIVESVRDGLRRYQFDVEVTDRGRRALELVGMDRDGPRRWVPRRAGGVSRYLSRAVGWAWPSSGGWSWPAAVWRRGHPADERRRSCA